MHGEAPDDGTSPLGNDVRRVCFCFISKGLDAFANNEIFGVVKMENISKNVINTLKITMIFFLCMIKKKLCGNMERVFEGVGESLLRL